jgi:hypothetical protein
MQLHPYRALGERIERQWRNLQYRHTLFPEIAARALSDVQLDDELDFDQLTAWALDARTPPQDAGPTFADLSLCVYEAPYFVIQILLWNEGVADIHQHGFSGAFRVLAGASVHATYALPLRREVNELMRIVDVESQRVELLDAGDVRAIWAGAGLTHGVFHLDVPTLSVVVRTRSEPWHGPQYLVLPPHLALAGFALEQDPRAAFLCKCVRAMHQMRHPHLADVLIARLRELDFPRVCQVVRKCHGVVGSHLPRVVAAMRETHGELAQHLIELVEELERVETIKAFRVRSDDPDHRFFLAALLYCDSRAALERLAAARYPAEHDVSTLCASLGAELPPRLLPYFERLHGGR